MHFTGRVYYDFESKDVWRFFQLLLVAQREGAQPGLEWKPFVTGPIGAAPLHGHLQLLAAAEVVRHDAVLAHGPFLAGVLTAIHREGVAIEDPDLVTLALRVAELEADFLTDTVIEAQGRRLLEASLEEAAALGVDAVPSIYRHGPVVAVRTTAAVTLGSGLRRLEIIDAMLDDDGLWELRKP